MRTPAWSLSLSLLLLTTAACGSDGGASSGIIEADTTGDASTDVGGDAAGSGDTADDTGTSADTTAGSGDTGGDTGGDTAPVSACADAVAQCGPAAIASCIETDGGGLRCACDAEAERALLLDGVTSFDTDGALPSYLVVGGRNAFPVIVDSGERIIAAAAFQGAGRVFTIAHEGLLNRDDAASPGLAQLVRNAVSWAGTGSSHTGVIALDRSYDRAAAMLEAEGYTVVVGAADALDGVDVFVTTNYEEYSEANAHAAEATAEAPAEGA